MIGLPFFKMIFISEEEQITGTDVIFAGVTTILGVPVIILLFLSLHTYSENYFHDLPDKLSKLSSKINQRFQTENETIVDSLKSFDFNAYDISYNNKSDTNEIDSTIFEKYKEKDSLLQHHFKFISKVAAKKIDNLEVGDVPYHVNFIEAPEDASKSSNTTNLSKRTYFKDLINDINVWKLNNQKYVMRSMVGIADGKEEAVYILKSNSDDFYKVGSVQLQSLHHPILPFGYEFAVIDPEGNVQFHSKKGKASYENFYAVSEKHENLKAAVSGRVSVNGTLFYHADQYFYHLEPIKGTNLSLVVMYKLTLLRLQVTEALSISSMALLIAACLLAFLTIISVFLKKPKFSLLKVNRFHFDYLCPKADRINYYNSFSIIFIISLALFILCIYPFDLKPSLAFIFSLLVVVWSYSLVYFSLQSKESNFRIKEPIMILLIISLNFLIFKNWQSSLLPIIVWQLFIILCILFFYFNFKKPFINFPLKSFWSLKYAYTFFIFSWLLAAVVFPAYLFYSKAGAIEELIWTKTNQFHISKAYEKKRDLLKKDLKPPKNKKSKTPIKNDLEKTYKMHLKEGLYVDDDFGWITQKSEKNSFGKPSFFRELLWLSRPIYDERIRKFQPLIFQYATDFSWTSKVKAGNNHFNYEGTNGAESIHSTVGLQKSSGLIADLSQLTSLKGFTKWGGLALILLIFFYLILFYVNRFFAFRFQTISSIDYMNNQKINALLQNLLQSNSTNIGLLLIGVPFSGKSNYVSKIIKEGNLSTKTTEISFFWLEPQDQELKAEEIIQSLINKNFNQQAKTTDWKNKDIFILKNLEHDCNSFENNRLKLKIISFLFSQNKKIVITSEIYPSRILSFYSEQIDEAGKMNSELASDYNSWRNILSLFYQLIIGLHKIEISDFKKEEEESPSLDTGIKSKISQEIAYGQFLPSLGPLLVENNTSPAQKKDLAYNFDEEKMILHVLHHSHGYYTDIWNGLSPRERYMLHDLAIDEFLNIKNAISLFSLMKKGLVVWNDRPDIFNQSFRNFIIYSVPKSEALHFEITRRGNGSWGTIRIILFLIIITVLIFIVLGDPELFAGFEGFYGALAGLGAIIPIISSLLARSGK